MSYLINFKIEVEAGIVTGIDAFEWIVPI